MKAWLKRMAGADRPKVIAVVAVTREDAAAAVAHARTGSDSLPIWVWCSEHGEGLADCDRYTADAGAVRVFRDMRQIWPALSITGWTGHQLNLATLIPFLFLPLRIVIFNEARGFSAAKAGFIAAHARRRIRDASRSAAIRLGEWTRSIAYRAWERVRDVVRLAGSFAYRCGQRVRDVFLWLWNLMLACAAACSPLVAPLSYALSRKYRIGPAAVQPLPTARSTEYLPVEISARAWRRKRILRQLSASDVPFVVLHRGTLDAAECADLLSLALSENAFAAAKQAAYTGWRRQVLSKHPFRVLQQGEVSSVLAPHSSLIVMRRDMLLKLGLPHAVTNGAALMQIYWKAAAAGWSSLVQGSGGLLPQEPAMPLEDAEFALRLALRRKLNRFAPFCPEQNRGNIARQPSRAPHRRIPRVLVVSPYLPFPLSHGGAVRIYNLCKSLSRQTDFTLVCFREAGEHVDYDELHRVFRSVYVVDVDEKHPDDSVPEQVAGYRNSAMSSLIRSLCVSGGIDVLQLEYTQMAEYRACAEGLPTILVEHDITFTLHRQISDTAGTPGARQQYEKWLEFECAALRTVDCVWTMSQQDLLLAHASGATAGIRVIPNGVDLTRFRPERRAGGLPTILFVGSFRHLPNLLAYEVLLEQIMPSVWARCPEAVLSVIAGPRHETAAQSATKQKLLAPHPRVRMNGYVADVRTAYRDCDVVAVPLPISAGTNIKVMEAMACGRAVVSTTVGCQGLALRDGEDVVVRDEPAAFAEALLLLLTDADDRARIAANGRHTVEQRFGWDAIAHQAFDSYLELSRSRAVA